MEGLLASKLTVLFWCGKMLGLSGAAAVNIVNIQAAKEMDSLFLFIITPWF